MKPILEPQLDRGGASRSLVQPDDPDAPARVAPRPKAQSVLPGPLVVPARPAQPRQQAQPAIQPRTPPVPVVRALELPPHRKKEIEDAKRREAEQRDQEQRRQQQAQQPRPPVLAPPQASVQPAIQPLGRGGEDTDLRADAQPLEDARISVFSPRGLPLPPAKPGTVVAAPVPALLPGLVAPAQPAGDEDEPFIRTTLLSPRGYPIPGRKPRGLSQRADPGLIERILATPSEGDLPHPPTYQGTVEPTYQPPRTVRAPVEDSAPSTVRIRDRSRFDSSQRMAGATPGRVQRLSSLGLPRDMQNLRLGRLGEADGISPVLMPGQKVVMAAPDAPRMDRSGIPAEVIVFFQENSRELEVGQMDILNNDVVAALKGRNELELEIVGYSEPLQGGSSQTESMSLARAIMIRDYLVRQRIDADRLTVRAKGDDTGIEPRDRVEMFFSR